MRILFCGDIVGRSGRDIVIKQVPKLRAQLKLDAVIVNCENAAHGFGITSTMSHDLFACGVDCLTLGNHAWDQKEIIPFIDREPRLVRPANYPPGTPGRGSYLMTTAKGQKILIINMMTRLFMEALDDPFQSIEEILQRYNLGKTVHAIFVDLHGEASSEKMAFAHVCDGRVSAVVGTHTHTPTADQMIFDGGTAFTSDAGMCGDYNSVIGMSKDFFVYKFRRRMSPPERVAPAEGPGTLCGVFIEIDDQSGLATRIEPVRIGPRLHEHIPVVD